MRMYVFELYSPHSHSFLTQFPPKASVGVHLVQSASLALLPPLYFFSFLYYTDCGSMFWIIFTYYLHLCKRHNWAALSGLVSMFFRQTNVIWIFFFAAHSAIEVSPSPFPHSIPLLFTPSGRLPAAL